MSEVHETKKKTCRLTVVKIIDTGPMVDNDDVETSSNKTSTKNKRPIPSTNSSTERPTKKLKKEPAPNNEQQKSNSTKKSQIVENKSSTKTLEQNSSMNKDQKNKTNLVETKKTSSKPTTKIIRAQSTGDLKLCLQTKPTEDLKKRNSSPPVIKNKSNSSNTPKITPNKSSIIKKPSPLSQKPTKLPTNQSNQLPSTSSTGLINKSIPIKKSLQKNSTEQTANNSSTKIKPNIPQKSEKVSTNQKKIETKVKSENFSSNGKTIQNERSENSTSVSTTNQIPNPTKSTRPKPASVLPRKTIPKSIENSPQANLSPVDRTTNESSFPNSNQIETSRNESYSPLQDPSLSEDSLSGDEQNDVLSKSDEQATKEKVSRQSSTELSDDKDSQIDDEDMTLPTGLIEEDLRYKLIFIYNRFQSNSNEDLSVFVRFFKRNQLIDTSILSSDRTSDTGENITYDLFSLSPTHIGELANDLGYQQMVRNKAAMEQ